VARRLSKSAERRIAAAAAVKERRKKVIAFGGLGVLVLLLVIQGPKLFDLLSGPAVPEAVGTPAATSSEPTPKPRGLPKALRFSSPSDPFLARRLVGRDPQVGSFPAPAGLSDPFRKIDSPEPATPPATRKPPAAVPATPLPDKIVLGTPSSPNARGTRGWIVVIASIPVRSGRASAERFARQVRADGLSTIDVLVSSQSKPLRAGYFVVYNGPYTTLRSVQRAGAHVRAFGYRDAYIRPIIRY
jgi:hypothetical protein